MTCHDHPQRPTWAERHDKTLGYLVAVGLVAGAIHPLLGVVAVLAMAAILAAVSAAPNERNDR
jgi:hypothetical protein